MKVCVCTIPDDPWIGTLVGDPNALRIQVEDDLGVVHTVNTEDCEFLNEDEIGD